MSPKAAREAWTVFVASHNGDGEAAVGELVAALVDAGLLTDGRRPA